MQIFQKLLAVISLTFFVGCASTHGAFITEHKNAWIDGYNLKSIFADKGLLFCMANIKEEAGLADPVCFETRFEEYEDEKPRVEQNKKILEVKKVKVEEVKPEESTKKKD
jgi:hypothetical protein